MSRLTDDQVKAGLLHEDLDVRDFALDYFWQSETVDPTVMPMAIQALERYGKTTTFEDMDRLADLPQSEETIGWVLREWAAGNRKKDDYHKVLATILMEADARLLLPCQQEILESRIFRKKEVERFTRRLQMLSRDGASLWKELETLCEENRQRDTMSTARWDRGKDIVVTLARDGDQHAGHMMELLQKTIAHPGSSLRWVNPVMAFLAGLIRHAPAIPLLIQNLHNPDPTLIHGESVPALIRIGGDELVDTLVTQYFQSESDVGDFRFDVVAILGGIHSDAAVDALMTLMNKEEDAFMLDAVAINLAGQASTEGNEIVHRWIREYGGALHVLTDLIASCKLTGQDITELIKLREEEEEGSPEWEEEEEEEQAEESSFLREVLGAAAAPEPGASEPPHTGPYVRQETRVGRNDPCPCGSGKKYKKCCMLKKDTL